MKLDEEMCRKVWSKNSNYLCFDKARNKKYCKYRSFSESKKTYIDCIPESEPFRIRSKNTNKHFSYQGRYCVVIYFRNKHTLCFQIF